MIRLYEAFIIFSPTVDPSTYYLVQGNIHPGYNFAQVWLYAVVTITGDSVLVWRCHAVWGRKYWYITLIPALSVLATTIGGFGAPSVTLKLSSESPEVAANFAPLAASFATTEIATSLVTNLLTTIIIGGRIWWVSTRMGGKNRFSRVISLVVESGTLLTLLKITEFSLYRVAVADVNNIREMFWTVWSCVPQVVAIVPTLIIIVVTTGHTAISNSAVVPSTSLPSTMMFSPNQRANNPTGTMDTSRVDSRFGTTSGTDSNSVVDHPSDKV